VVIADLNEDAAKKIQQEYPDTTAAIRCDVLSWKDQVATFKKAIELSPSKEIDIVVANAGIAIHDSILTNDTSLDEPEEPKFPVLDVNINGVFYTTKLAQWYFEKQNSSGEKKERTLVLQASLAGYLDLISPQYSASKFAVRGLMRAMRTIAPKHGYKVGVIAPWYVLFALSTWLDVADSAAGTSGLLSSVNR
jgi:NAD(P)-dependent dehydrogenase (short-subunit alcohol dehydrogenase family)